MNNFYDDEANADLAFTPSELSERSLLSHEFITQVIKLGCTTTVNGKVTFNQILDWVAEHCDEFCIVSNLPIPAPPTADDPPRQDQWNRRRACIAISRFHESRSDDADRKKQLTSLLMEFMLWTQPCYCGSGREFKDCCGADLFATLIANQMT
jgi:hypothetical protein